MRFVVIAVAMLLAQSVVGAQPARSHCQVPCGIYDDHARVHGMLEDTTTIAKAVDRIAALAGKTDATSVNQAARWVATKESHASQIIDVVAHYFLTQKITPQAPGDPGWPKYVGMLADHHAVMRLAMKAKQTVDPTVVASLRKAIEKLSTYWPAAR